MDTHTIVGTAMDSRGNPPPVTAAPELLKLLTFLSPAFPVGSFSYSHGIEWLIDRGTVRNAEALQAWLHDLLSCGSLWNDAVLFAEAHRAAEAGDVERLRAIAEIGEALAASRERHLESMAEGRAFLAAVASAWPSRSIHALDAGAPYPVAVGAVAADQRIALRAALPAYLNAFLANLVSVGVRLVPIGQSAGLKIIAALHSEIVATAARAEKSTLDDLGSATILSDIASMRHEMQYSRVFRT